MFRTLQGAITVSSGLSACLLPLVSLFFLLPGYLSAQAYQCNGVWTMEPCEGGTKRDLPRIGKHKSRDYEVNQIVELNEVDAGRESLEEEVVLKKTRLRMEGQPKWFINQSARGIILSSAEVLIRNAGQHTAEGVSVTAILGQGMTDNFRGPNSIEPGKSVLYRISGTRKLDGRAKLRVEFQCDNCRR